MTRTRSPLAHGPAQACRSCIPCPSCDGGLGSPKQYRVRPRAVSGRALHVCSRCDGLTRSCLNLVPELQP